MKKIIEARRTFLLVSIFIIGDYLNAFSQSLQMGDKTPEFESDQVLNHTSNTISLSDIKKKWILIDFWSTGCASCIANFGKTDALQKKFNDDLQIILINKQSLDSTKKFFISKKKVIKPNVPMITGDKLLHEMFPHDAYPYYVLLDENRKVVAFPEYKYIAEKSFRNLIDSNQVNFGQEYSNRHKYGTPLFASLEPTDGNSVMSYFFITTELKGFRGRETQRVRNPKFNDRICFLNMPMGEIIRESFNREGKNQFAVNTILIESSRKKAFQRPKDVIEFDAWRTQNLYCVDLLVKPEDAKNMFNILRSRIEEYFNIEIQIKKISRPCYVLKKIPGHKSLKTKGGLSSFEDISENGVKMMAWKNQPFSEVITTLRFYFEAAKIYKTFVDESGITGNVDMKLNASFFDKFADAELPDINMSLAEHDLVIVEEDHVVDAIIIKDKK